MGGNFNRSNQYLEWRRQRLRPARFKPIPRELIALLKPITQGCHFSKTLSTTISKPSSSRDYEELIAKTNITRAGHFSCEILLISVNAFVLINTFPIQIVQIFLFSRIDSEVQLEGKQRAETLKMIVQFHKDNPAVDSLQLSFSNSQWFCYTSTHDSVKLGRVSASAPAEKIIVSHEDQKVTPPSSIVEGVNISQALVFIERFRRSFFFSIWPSIG